MADDRSGHDQTWGRPDATDRIPSPRTTIATDIPTLRLVTLSQNDAAAYYDLVDRNRTHLTRHGDWRDLGEATPESVRADLAHLESLTSSFGVWLAAQHDTLVNVRSARLGCRASEDRGMDTRFTLPLHQGAPDDPACDRA